MQRGEREGRGGEGRGGERRKRRRERREGEGRRGVEEGAEGRREENQEANMRLLCKDSEGVAEVGSIWFEECARARLTAAASSKH